MLAQQLVNGLALGSCYALVALGLTLVFGVLLIPNFPHGELYMFGASITYTLTVLGLNFWLSAVAGTLAATAIGVMLDYVAYRPIERRDTLSLLIAALAASIVLQEVASIIWGSELHTTPSPLTGVLRTRLFSITSYQLLIGAVTIIAWLGLWLVLNRSRLGLAVRAVAQNRAAAQLMGIDLGQVRVATFALGAMLGGVAGALLGASFPIYPTMGVNPILKAFVVLVIGGVGNLWGAVAGGLLLGIVETLVAGYISSELQDIGTFAVLVLVLLIRPQGLLGQAEVER